jgi:predicted GNAT family acetyltransferase
MPNSFELDNPVWWALTTCHEALARKSGAACRYPSRVSPFAALREPNVEAFAALSALVEAREGVGLATALPVHVPSGWQVIRSHPIEQMICTTTMKTSPPPPLTLDQTDVPEMMALAAATEPGPFLPETIRMGRYFGIKSPQGRLIAMAGERLKLEGFTEISAVCTSPEFRGRGYAASLVTFLVHQLQQEGTVPFLHVTEENPARSLYEKLGFRVRRAVQLTVIARA